MSTTKDRQRWQPEEDAILCAYVAQFGPHEWNLISEKMGTALDRDPKSCHERWKNYLKPGIKKGPLTEDEQNLVIKLQTKYGNKWKRIAAEVPGRTAKRLGKWWEVYKERKLKEKKKSLNNHNSFIASGNVGDMSMDLPIFSRPFISSIPDLCVDGAPAFSTSTPGQDQLANNMSGLTTAHTLSGGDETLLTLGPSTSFPNVAKQSPAEVVATSGVDVSKWIQKDLEVHIATTLNGTGESSLSFSSEGGLHSLEPTTESSENSHKSVSLLDLLKELKEQQDNWFLQKKRMGLKVMALKTELNLERMDKQRQKIEEVDAKVRALKEEEKHYLLKLEQDYGDMVSNVEKDAELKESKLMEAWMRKYEALVHFYKRYTISGGLLGAT